jgi:hypothetical protein
MSRFCRHNRFIERCPICRETVPGLAPPAKPGETRVKGSTSSARASTRGKRPRRDASGGMRVYTDGPRRAEEDGYRSALAPGLRASLDAGRLAEEIGFATGRLLALTASPPGLYGEIRELGDLEQATWTCFLTAYLSPLDGPDPFLGIRQALGSDWRQGELPDLQEIPLGPRTSHDPVRGSSTLQAYRQWIERAGSQEQAFSGDPAWSRPRRFERLFERLILPGFGRMGRYDLLVTLGRLGLYELRADSLHFSGAQGPSTTDLATLAAKRAFGIGDPLILERRALDLARAASVPVEALDLALANWGTGQRATMGFAPESIEEHAHERALGALGL